MMMCKMQGCQDKTCLKTLDLSLSKCQQYLRKRTDTKVKPEAVSHSCVLVFSQSLMWMGSKRHFF